MVFGLTKIFDRNQAAIWNPAKRIAINEGGTSSSKTFSILQLLTQVCQSRTKPLLVSVVSESFPHLAAGCIRDWKMIMGEGFDDKKWNATNHVYTFSPGVQMEFFSADQPGKAHGPRRDILFCNEVNNIPKPIYDALSLRTRRFEFLDFNPVGEFWAHELQSRPEVEWIHSTYLDALPFLPARTVEKIEAMRETDPNGWRIYGEGKVGNVTGLVHPLFTTCEVMPSSGEYDFYGLDFGYTNDPTALTHNIIQGKDLYSDELIYETGMLASDIVKRLSDIGVRKGYDEIFADESRPETIAEIAMAGFNCQRAPKGPESVILGIQKVNEYRQHWTSRSVNGIKEQRNYRYITDKDGKITNKPIDSWGHLQDSRRYGVWGKMAQLGDMPSICTLSDEDLGRGEQPEYIS
jgi:phage terminase large subunit